MSPNFSNKSIVESNSRLHDSVLIEAVKIIKEKYLLVDKPSRKTTILEIGFDHSTRDMTATEPFDLGPFFKKFILKLVFMTI